MDEKEEKEFWRYLYESGARQGDRFLTVLPIMFSALHMVSIGSLDYPTYKLYVTSLRKYLESSEKEAVSYMQE